MSEVFTSGWSVLAWSGLVVAIAQIAIAHGVLRRGAPTGALGWAWRVLAAVGFVVTWTFMLRMASGDIARYASLADWSRDSNLFFDAYRRVTSTPAAWWWSQQLMAWALAGTLWFSVEGRRRGIRFWAYLWLAMCVAVSVALPIFAQRLRAARTGTVEGHADAGVPVSVFLGVLLATLALAATPFVSGARFIAAMLVLHAGLLLPAVAMPRSPGGRPGVDPRVAASVVALACFAIHLVATVRLHAVPLGALLDVVARDPAQASISSDVVLTWIGCGLLVATTRSRRAAILFLFLAPVVSLGGAFAWAMASGWAARAPRPKG
jgi:hypothetical protein